MLEIQENFNTAGYESIIALAGLNNLHITEAIEKNQVSGFIAYAYESERTVVYDYNDNGDLMLCDGLVRSIIFKSVIKGIKTMVFEIPDRSKFSNLKKLNFISDNSNICENLDSFMNACESCKNKDK